MAIKAKSVYALGFLGLSVFSVKAQSALYGQCGGTGWTGATTCVAGATCTVLNPYYSQCLPGSSTSSTTTTISSTTSKSLSTVSTPTSKSTSKSTSTTTSSSTTKTSSSISTTSTKSTTTTTSTTSSTTTSSAPAGSCTPNSPPASAGTLQLTGVNISGFDFGCNSDGSCTASAAWPPLTQYYGADGKGQMTHFVNDDGFNTFRLPVGWQFLVNDVLGASLNAANLAEYDALVQACLGTGAKCIIDVHNYARWDKGIIGQGGPTNDQFAALWSQIATVYKNEPNIIFGVMNEPHDVPDINLWAGSVQAAVTAIRNAGATTQLILLPGNNWTSAQTFISNGSAAALSTVVNPDGSFTGLIFDVHKYLDYDNSGTNSECVSNNIASSWEPLAQWLRCNGRQAFNTETGGGNVASCVQYLCEQIAYQAQNSDVFLGYVGWAAGNFQPGSYVLGETPSYSNGVWTDTLLVSSCLAPNSGSQKGSTGM